MRGKGKLLIALLVAASASVLLSGCFAFSSFKWSSVSVKPGKSVDAKLGLLPFDGHSNMNPQRVYPVVLVGFASPTQLALGGKSKFDTAGKFGGPYPMVQDGALAASTIGSDNCQFGGQHLEDISGVATWKAVRTDTKVSDKDKTKTEALAKVQIKAISNAVKTQETLYFVIGNWTDADDNHNPTEEEVGCTGGIINSLTITG